ncbi:MAG: class IV adenylate cyclase [Bernardetiaceae bacterium]|nr:class IV adenylate cyclase [Bernardetiaceae bacterium]
MTDRPFAAPGQHLNVEIKARCADLAPLRQVLLSAGADCKGTDHQTDTYFRVPHGRLKMREGNLERALIFYHRPNQAAAKKSEVQLWPLPPEPGPLKSLLVAACGVLAVVAKAREIYFIDNVKFHLDQVDGLGTFVEIEAIDYVGTLGEAYLHQQCNHYRSLLRLEEADLLAASYSDMLLGSSDIL